jgi:tRNA pseudouridine32 synthase/23S rRNA pseudouridine746 synthase
VHKGPKGGASLEDYFDALRFGLPRMPALAHRLDKETSGCLVLGRHRKALADLNDLFRYGKVGKTYWAVVEGGPAEPEGRIDLPLGRLDDKIGWWMKHDPDGLPSQSTWKVMGRAEGMTWLALEPLTGRTHLVRALRREWAGRSSATISTAPRAAQPAARLHLHAREMRCAYKNRADRAVTPVPAYARA